MGLITDRRDLTHTFLLFDLQLTIWICSIVTFQDRSEIGIFMIDEIRTMNMVLRGDNVVLRLLLERQDHAICTHGLAQSKKDLLWIKHNLQKAGNLCWDGAEQVGKYF